MSARAAAPLWLQMQVLTSREFLMRRRTPLLTKAVIGRSLILGLLLGFTLFRLKVDQTSVYSINGSMMFGMFTFIMPTAVGHVSTLPAQLPCRGVPYILLFC